MLISFARAAVAIGGAGRLQTKAFVKKGEMFKNAALIILLLFVAAIALAAHQENNRP